MKKIGLYIINQLHDITQAGFEVKFAEDFEGMLRLDFFKELDPEFYEHEHIGYPGQPREKLEEGVIQALNSFRERHKLT